jgi:Ser/Thr protein kinase RdoA (MazF antagonist)
MQPFLQRYATQVLGEHSVLAEHPRAGKPPVVELCDGQGERWFLKVADNTGLWRAEVRAYRQWVSDLADRAPRLGGADPTLRTILVSAVPGRMGQIVGPSPDMHHTAGSLLRRFHQAKPARLAKAGFSDWLCRRLENCLRVHPDLFSGAEREFAREQTRRLLELAPFDLVPCHGDFRPGNWLQDDDGAVYVIDFERSRLQVWASDLIRLYLGPWWGRPCLPAAFLDGYGRKLTEKDHDFIQLSSAPQMMINAAWCHSHNRPQAEHQARRRLAQLMAGYPVTERHGPSFRGRLLTRLRRSH